MSSINRFPTFHYSQPSEYHFSHDSVFLAREVYERHGEQLAKNEIKILDLCAGCGIVGMDLLFHQLKEKTFNGEIDFLEVQSVYETHFAKNKEIMQGYFPDSRLNFNFILQNYAEVTAPKKYDFILSNPPYFLIGQGVKSPSEFKNRCRFFMDADWQAMLSFMQASLKPEGQAYFLVRDELKDIISRQPASEVTFPFKVRTAWVAHMKKLSSID